MKRLTDNIFEEEITGVMTEIEKVKPGQFKLKKLPVMDNYRVQVKLDNGFNTIAINLSEEKSITLDLNSILDFVERVKRAMP